MDHTAPARAEARRSPGLVLVGLALVIAAMIGALAGHSVSSPAPTVGEVLRGDHHSQTPASSPASATDLSGPPRSRAGTPPLAARSSSGVLGQAHGAVPHGTTVFDTGIPGVANLDPSLLKALQRAATDAAKDGVVFQVTSGWRSPERQEQLLSEAVAEYGSEDEAARWVATANTSPHVSGDAVDIGPAAATAWLSRHGVRYGLCQIYRNEPWHYELRPEAISRGCPRMYADPTHDPRMQQ